MHPDIVAKSYFAALLDIPALAEPDLPGVGGRVYPDSLDDTEDNSFPAVLYQIIGKQRNTADFSDIDTEYPMDILVKVVGKSVPDVDLVATYDLVKAALHRKRGFVGPDEVITCYEYQTHSLSYRDPQTGVKYPEVGGYYHVVVELH